MKFRKKPVIIEARQFTGSWENAQPILAWMEPAQPIDASGPYWSDAREGQPEPVIYIYTLEGKMTASPGDWIIRGVQGEFYPCKDSIFQATYEPVEED